jgi:ribonuclease J
MRDRVRIIPLGGMGEVGRNMTVVEYEGQIVIIDCGLMFPERDMLGIDLVIPDFSYVRERQAQVVGLLVTHGHEDHIGAIPYLLREMQMPIFATPLTRGLIEVKLKEHKLLKDADVRTIRQDARFTLGPFAVEAFPVSHSIPDAVGYALTTPAGLVVHTGEYKFDFTAVAGRATDVQKLAELGMRGVLALLSDSTNAERMGHTPSERLVTETFDRLFAIAERRVIVATFASNISRVQQVIDAAHRHGREVGVVGRSMQDNVNIARELGYLTVPQGRVLRIEELDKLPDEKVAIVCTGSQGEPTSALTRMANGEHRLVRIRENDTVILSATPIPGNEELVYRTVNNLYRLGARVYYQSGPLPGGPHGLVHVSGHAAREEQKLMLNLVRPRYFVPIQGEYRHLVLHAELGMSVGIPRERIFVLEDGAVLELGENFAEVVDRLEAGYVFVDGLRIGDIGQVVIRDRHHLAQDGFLVAIVVLTEAGNLEDAQLVSRGFVYQRDADDLLEEARQLIVQVVSDHPHRIPEGVDELVKGTLGEFVHSRTGRRPMILPVVMKV